MVSRWIYWVCLVAMILSLGYFGFWMAIIGSWLPGFPWIYHLTDAVILCAAISIVTYRKRPRWTLLCAWAFFSVCLWVYLRNKSSVAPTSFWWTTGASLVFLLASHTGHLFRQREVRLDVTSPSKD